jgi:RNA polymerase sigma-70 factor (ECF subfamily)
VAVIVAVADAQPDSGLWTLVRTLPSRQAQALTLVYGFDLSIQGAAEVVQRAQSSAKTHLSRGRAALGAMLGERS